MEGGQKRKIYKFRKFYIFMLGSYHAKRNRTISYRGNNLFRSFDDVLSKTPDIKKIERRVLNFYKDAYWGSIAKINHRINRSTNDYFDELGAVFTTLPLTTRMISSPGAVYGRKAINYTTDTCPIKLKWFELPNEVFLSESSQIYLELSLIQKGIDQVYSIYNSFRKEKADATHLSEFHHIEYEGKILQRQNELVSLGLISRILQDLLKNNEKDLAVFLNSKKLSELERLSLNIQKIPKITYQQAQDALYKETGDDRYKRFTMQNNFGSWEEVKLTEIFGDMIAIREFPLLEVPFYHAAVNGKTPPVADNTDIIWPGYREILGSGHRVRSKQDLEEKARIFNLPKEDYTPYLQTRQFNNYKETSGFGLGWERLLQGILEMPFIWSAMQFPRVDGTLKP